jgi:hypothetical protein
VDRYFADEREKVSTYNNRRGELIAKTSSLNSAIEDWNKKGRIRWERYVAELKEMEDAELRAFQTAAELYIKACKEERSYFQRLSEGYQQGEKQCVIERLGFVLDRITLPRSLPHTWEIDFDDDRYCIEVFFASVQKRTPGEDGVLVLSGSEAAIKPIR